MRPKNFRIAIDIDQLAEQIKDAPSVTRMQEYTDYIERRMFVGDVTDHLYDYVGYRIKEYNRQDEDAGIKPEDRKPIKIFINSDGGAVNPTMSTIDLIEGSKTPVYTYCARAYSAGGMLLMSGHKRYALKNSTFLLHSGSSGAYGDTNQVRDTVDFYKKFMKEKMVKHILEKTLITEEEYLAHEREEWYMMAEEMLERGIVDEIVEFPEF